MPCDISPIATTYPNAMKALLLPLAANITNITLRSEQDVPLRQAITGAVRRRKGILR